MSELTLLEMAANVRQRRMELDAICAELKSAGIEWTKISIAASDAMKIAEDGLRNAWSMLDRLYWIAESQKR